MSWGEALRGAWWSLVKSIIWGRRLYADCAFSLCRAPAAKKPAKRPRQAEEEAAEEGGEEEVDLAGDTEDDEPTMAAKVDVYRSAVKQASDM